MKNKQMHKQIPSIFGDWLLVKVKLAITTPRKFDAYVALY